MLDYRVRSEWRAVAVVIVLLACARGSAADLEQGGGPSGVAASAPVRLAVFDVDATPPLGARMAYRDVERAAELPLRCRGIVLLGAGEPIVLCCLDWIAIGNGGHDAFREGLAAAAGTRPERVAVHTTHAHDAPYCDLSAAEIAAAHRPGVFRRLDDTLPRDVIARTAAAIREALPAARPATHWGCGRAPVTEVASNRRLIGADGKVRHWRASATAEPALRAEPEGLIDPFVTALVFWHEAEPLAVLTAYACHPQSYYRTGTPSVDFPGIARFIRSQDVPAALHVHFDGAGGDIAAGKYNDGSHANRMRLATRLAAGMRQAFEMAKRQPLVAADVGWSTAAARLEPAAHLDREALLAELKAANADRGPYAAPERLSWLERAGQGRPLLVTCLRVGTVRMLHLPGELFVAYQLAAQRMRPDLDVMVAAYGDIGPGYIGTAAAYAEGGYELQPKTSFVDARAEPVLHEAIRTLLEVQP
jgi:hypothetical protein